VMAIIGGPPARFGPVLGALRAGEMEKFGRPRPLTVMVHSPGSVAATNDQAKAEV